MNTHFNLYVYFWPDILNSVFAQQRVSWFFTSSLFKIKALLGRNTFFIGNIKQMH